MKIGNGLYDQREEMLVVMEEGILRSTSLARITHVEFPIKTPHQMVCAGERELEALKNLVAQATRLGVDWDPEPDVWLPPITRPDKVICVGLNYRPHAAESKMEIPEYPVLFNKFGTSLVGHGATVHPPRDAHQMDYEAELVIVMGQRCHKVTENEALDYVFGYCNGNDLSARDLQFRTSQWLSGKASDGFGPIGPYLVTRDEVPDPSRLDIVGYRNGQEVQRSNTAEMIFSCRYLVSYLSQFMTLVPGDLIFTGTPEGVLLGYPEPRPWLRAGDRFTVAIEGLGELETHIGSADD